MSNPFRVEGQERLDLMDCHVAPCCGHGILAPVQMKHEGEEAVKDHMAECMVDAIAQPDLSPEDREATIAETRKMFE